MKLRVPSRLVLPYVRAELPGWGRVYQMVALTTETSANEPPVWRTIRGKWHGYRMRLNLANWSERSTYFLGRFYDLKLQLVMNDILEPGDRFVDIGGNIGMVSLHGAALVGPTGRVETFEPNPDCLARLAELRETNGISQWHVYPFALSDKPGELLLNVVTTHTGMGTLAPVGDALSEMVSKRHPVRVQVGDEMLLDRSEPIKLLKIDVEGFEHHVLRGLERTLDRWHPYVVTEFVESHLQRAGTSRQAVTGFMLARGYRAYTLACRRQGLRHRLCLVPMQDQSDAANCTDVLWEHRAGPDAPKLRSHVLQVAR